MLPANLGKTKYEQGWRPKHPVIVISGFRSSALKVEETFHDRWRNERVWLSVEKLNFLASQGDVRDDFDKTTTATEGEWLDTKDLWVRHLALNTNGDGFSDPEGIKVRPLEGIAGVDYLAPGFSFTESISFVFGPLVRVLRGVGYTEENMAAAPYDWRVSPAHLEKRDKYFTKLMQTIEKMKQRNVRKVVILTHSMGYRTGHYFLKFVEKTIPNGRAWIDENIEFFFAASPLMLGAPRSLRGVLIGDKMGMDSFLTDEEAIFMARSWGSTPWLFPVREDKWQNNKSFLYSRVEGILNVEVVGIKFPRAQETVAFDAYINVGYKEHMLHTTLRDASANKTVLWNEHFQFVSSDPTSLNVSDVITFELRKREKGIARLFHKHIGGISLNMADVLKAAAGYQFEGTLPLVDQSYDFFDFLGTGKDVELPSIMLKISWTEGSGTSERRLVGEASSKTGKVSMEVKFNGEMTGAEIDDALLAPEKKGELTDLIKEASSNVYQRLYKMTRHFKFQFEPRSMKDVLEDGARDSYKQFEANYVNDPLYGVNDICLEPPHHKMKVVYGINVNTEVCYFFKRKNIKKRTQYDCVYELDPTGFVEGYECKGGIAYETPETIQTRPDTGEDVRICGDGTVPYASLNYCATWKNIPGIELTIDEIPGSRHREILADPQFHEYVLKYLCSEPTSETAGKEKAPPNTEHLEYEDVVDEIKRSKQAIGQKVSETFEDLLTREAAGNISRNSVFLDVPTVTRNRSSTVEVAKDAKAKTKQPPPQGQKNLASFFTSQEPSVHYDEYLKKQAAFEAKTSPRQQRKSFIEPEKISGDKTFMGVLRMQIKKAEGLLQQDVMGKGDFYCIVKLGNNSNELVKAARTHTLQGTTSPAWNESFIVDVKGASFIEFKVRDWDRFSTSDTCGRHVMSMQKLKPNTEQNFTLDLNPRGTLAVTLQFSPQ